MDSLIKQTRKRHSVSHEKTGEVGSSSREKKVPPRKSVSFKEDKKKAQNWLQKQFSRQMSSQSYDPISDMDHAVAVAATAYAITTFDETWLQSYQSGFEHGASLSKSKSRREDLSPVEKQRSLSKRFSGSFIELELNDKKLPAKSPSVKKTPTFSMNLRDDHTTKQSQDEKHERQRKPVSEPPLRTRSERRAPPPPPPPPPLQLPPREIKKQSYGQTSRKDDYTADEWEKAELAKIKARYEKLNRKIDLWEVKKRDKARRKLDKSESELEQRRKRGLQRYREDTEYIEQIADGARAQAEKQRHGEELKVKEKAGVLRTSGKLPGKSCLCF